MSLHFSDYYWSQGKPVGVRSTTQDTPISFKILTDPYHKRYSIERYDHGKFHSLIYDSALFDFRLLKKAEEAGWQREALSETPANIRSIIRNMEERIILIEEAFFEINVCRLCKILSPQRIEIAKQKMFYCSLGDVFNGVVLSDSLEHPILIKRYEIDPLTADFGTLLEEVWEHRPSS